MKTVTSFGYAKVNFYLDILGIQDGFHSLDSIVCTINLRDKLTLTTRKDDKIIIKKGFGGIDIPEGENNNAFKAAELFMKTFSTRGADIIINKKIPIGSGLGGSSADIAATLKGMADLYSVEADLKPLADSLGSDSGYLLSGGWARLSGRGEIVEPLAIDKKYYMIVVTAQGGVNTRDCYGEYDRLCIQNTQLTCDNAIIALQSGEISNKLYNALYLPACNINGEVLKVYEQISSLSPLATVMSGSGSSVVGIFETFELCEWAYTKLKYDYKDVFVTETLTLTELNTPSFFERVLYGIK